jgi:hypothetical protein
MNSVRFIFEARISREAIDAEGRTAVEAATGTDVVGIFRKSFGYSCERKPVWIERKEMAQNDGKDVGLFSRKPTETWSHRKTLIT